MPIITTGQKNWVIPVAVVIPSAVLLTIALIIAIVFIAYKKKFYYTVIQLFIRKTPSHIS